MVLTLKAKLGETPLHISSQVNHINNVKDLISQGADIECKAKLGESPLYILLLTDHINILKYLIYYMVPILNAKPLMEKPHYLFHHNLVIPILLSI